MVNDQEMVLPENSKRPMGFGTWAQAPSVKVRAKHQKLPLTALFVAPSRRGLEPSSIHYCRLQQKWHSCEFDQNCTSDFFQIFDGAHNTCSCPGI